MSFLETVRWTIEKHRMLDPKDRVLVGVSGGPDSVALLLSLVALREELRLKLRAVYLDHGARPAAAKKEKARVRSLGRLFGVPLSILSRSIRKEGGDSWEAVARSVRYEAFLSLARKCRLNVLALGHTQDDQAETVLMWILRGAGTTGLAGIPPLRWVPGPHGRGDARHDLRIIRPLIGCSRQEIEEFLKVHGIRALEDSSNRSLQFFRNRIRHELIPLLERRYSPKLRQHLGVLASILREDLEWLRLEVLEHFKKVARPGNGSVRLNRGILVQFPTPLRRGIFQMAVERLKGDRHGFASRHWEILDRFLLNGQKGRMHLPQGLHAQCKAPGWILLTRSGKL